jgi:hypothetical protein
MLNNLLIIKLLSVSIIGVCRSRKEWGQNVLCIEARQNPYCINDPLTQDSPIRAFKKTWRRSKSSSLWVEDATVLTKKL